MADETMMITFGTDLSKVRAELSAFRAEVAQGPVQIGAASRASASIGASTFGAAALGAASAGVLASSYAGMSPVGGIGAAASIQAAGQELAAAVRTVTQQVSGAAIGASGAVGAFPAARQASLGIPSSNSSISAQIATLPSSGGAIVLSGGGSGGGGGGLALAGGGGGPLARRTPGAIPVQVRRLGSGGGGPPIIINSAGGGEDDDWGGGGGDVNNVANTSNTVINNHYAAARQSGQTGNAERRSGSLMPAALFAAYAGLRVAGEADSFVTATRMGNIQAALARTNGERLQARLSQTQGQFTGPMGSVAGLMLDYTALGQYGMGPRTANEQYTNAIAADRLYEENRGLSQDVRGQSAQLGAGTSRYAQKLAEIQSRRERETVDRDHEATQLLITANSSAASPEVRQQARNKINYLGKTDALSFSLAQRERENTQYDQKIREYELNGDANAAQYRYSRMPNVAKAEEMYTRGDASYNSALRYGTPFEADAIKRKTAYELAGFRRDLIEGGSATAIENPLAFDFGQAGSTGQSSIRENDDILKAIEALTQKIDSLGVQIIDAI